MPEQSPIARLVGARSLNTFGRAVISTTVLYELYDRTDNAYVIGAVGLVQVIPVILLFVWSGSLADRVDRRTLTTLAATITGAIGVGLAVCSYFALPVWTYLVLLLVQGCVTSVHAPASSNASTGSARACRSSPRSPAPRSPVSR